MCALDFRHRPRQLVDGVKYGIASHLPEVRYEAHESLKILLVLLVQQLLLRLVE